MKTAFVRSTLLATTVMSGGFLSSQTLAADVTPQPTNLSIKNETLSLLADFLKIERKSDVGLPNDVVVSGGGITGDVEIDALEKNAGGLSVELVVPSGTGSRSIPKIGFDISTQGATVSQDMRAGLAVEQKIPGAPGEGEWGAGTGDVALDNTGLISSAGDQAPGISIALQAGNAHHGKNHHGLAGSGGSGGNGGVAGELSLKQTGAIATAGDASDGMLLLTTGGNGGDGGRSGGTGHHGGDAGGGGVGGKITATISGSIATLGEGSDGVHAVSEGGRGAHGGASHAIVHGHGGSGGIGGIAGDVTVTLDQSYQGITTQGAQAAGVVVQSIGGNGGAGGSFSGTVGSGGVGGGGAHGGLAKAVIGAAVSSAGDDSAGVLLQSIGGGGGRAGSGHGLVSIGGNGGAGADGGDVDLTLTSAVSTRGQWSQGVHLQSIGGGGGAAGSGTGLVAIGGGGASAGDAKVISILMEDAAEIHTTGDNSTGILAETIGGGGGAGGNGGGRIAIGGSAGQGGNGSTLDVDLAQLQMTTQGAHAPGLSLHSVGGGGGTGGGAGGTVTVGGHGGGGGDGGLVSVNQFVKSNYDVDVATQGDFSSAVELRSVGGGGGRGGHAVSLGAEIASAVGGKGGDGGDGGAVDAALIGAFSAKGSHSDGILAQSIGGGGGAGGTAVAVSVGVGAAAAIGVGGAGGGGGHGKGVTLSLGVPGHKTSVHTEGDHGGAVLAQSVGGGGGKGGMAFAVAAAIGEDAAAAIGVGIGGSGGKGGSGGNVEIAADTNTTTATAGDHAAAITAQSIGGGGGKGGSAIAGALAISAGPSVAVSVAVGGAGGSGGDGQTAKITLGDSATVQTAGDASSGLVAQSIGGGGGVGGFSASADLSVGSDSASGAAVALGGVGGNGGYGSAVTVQVKDAASIDTSGVLSTGIFAQSVGGGGGHGGASIAGSLSFGDSKAEALGVSLGGSGGKGGDAGQVSIGTGTSGTVATSGDHAAALFGQSVGGGGGTGGFAIAGSLAVSEEKSASADIAIGGKGGDGGTGGAVSIDNSYALTTQGEFSGGVFAQSVGGGGGAGGVSVAASLTKLSEQGEDSGKAPGKSTSISVALGGKGGTGGDAQGSAITNDGAVLTTGYGSVALHAQSVGGGGGHGGATLAASVSKAPKPAESDDESGEDTDAEDKTSDAKPPKPTQYALALGGDGGHGGHGGAAQITNHGDLKTTNLMAPAIAAQSVGGGGGAGGVATVTKSFRALVNDSIRLATGVDLEAQKQKLKDRLDPFSSGGDESKDAASKNRLGYQATNGVAGAGGDAASTSVQTDGTLSTVGFGSTGVLAQSVGGGGGVAYSVVNANDHSIDLGASETVGDGGGVTVTTDTMVFTAGEFSPGVLAQSIGGGGGIAVQHITADATGVSSATLGVTMTADSAKVAKTRSNESSDLLLTPTPRSSAGDVAVTTSGVIYTNGTFSHGIAAQSIGAGGGLIGASVDGVTADVRFGASAAEGSDLDGDGGDLTITAPKGSWNATTGDASHGILAQSIGGGGGFAGFLSDAQESSGIKNAIGDGGDITANVAGRITTAGANSHGIFAQSLGGGGGALVSDSGVTQTVFDTGNGSGKAGDINITVASGGYVGAGGGGGDGIRAEIGGKGGISGNGGIGGRLNVTVDGTVLATGIGGTSVSTKSIGDVGPATLTVGKGGIVVAGHGTALRFAAPEGASSAFKIINEGGIQGLGEGALVAGYSGMLNNSGTFLGDISLAADAPNGTTLDINNSGVLTANTVLDLGRTGTLSNSGMLHIYDGVTTRMNGIFSQTAQGQTVFDVDFAGGSGDRLEVSETAILDGSITVIPTTLAPHTPVTLITANYLEQDGLTVKNDSLVANYALSGNTKVLSVAVDTVDFTGGDAAISDNARSVGTQLNKLWEQGQTDSFAPALAGLAQHVSADALANDLESFASEHNGYIGGATANTTRQFADAMHSCGVSAFEGGVLSEGECAWWKPTIQTIEGRASDHTASGFALGTQWQVGDRWFIGASIGHQSHSVTAGSDTIDGETFELGAIAKYTDGDTLIALSVRAGVGDFDASRAVNAATAKSDFRQTSVGARLRFAEAIEFGNWFMTAQSDFDVSYLHAPGHTETGAGTLNLAVHDFDHWAASVTPRGTLGYTLTQSDGTTLRPSAFVGATFEANPDFEIRSSFANLPSSGSMFTQTIEGQDVTLLVGADIKIVAAQNFNFDIGYEAAFGDDVDRHQVTAKFGLRF